MKKLFVVLFVFVTSGLFADMDPQAFYSIMNIQLIVSSYAGIKEETFPLSVAELRKEDENKDGYFYSVDQISAATYGYAIVNVETRKVVYIVLTAEPDIAKRFEDGGFRVHGDISRFSNLKEQMIRDYDAARQRLGLRTRSTSSNIL